MKRIKSVAVFEDHVVCDCTAERLVFRHELDEGSAEISIWRHAYDKPGFWYRLRSAWRVLKAGTPYGDQIILNKKALQTLGSAITIAVNRMNMIEQVRKNAKKGKTDNV